MHRGAAPPGRVRGVGVVHQKSVHGRQPSGTVLASSVSGTRVECTSFSEDPGEGRVVEFLKFSRIQEAVGLGREALACRRGDLQCGRIGRPVGLGKLTNQFLYMARNVGEVNIGNVS